jgi:hypothetical protein
VGSSPRDRFELGPTRERCGWCVHRLPEPPVLLAPGRRANGRWCCARLTDERGQYGQCAARDRPLKLDSRGHSIILLRSECWRSRASPHEGRTLAADHPRVPGCRQLAGGLALYLSRPDEACAVVDSEACAVVDSIDAFRSSIGGFARVLLRPTYCGRLSLRPL